MHCYIGIMYFLCVLSGGGPQQECRDGMETLGAYRLFIYLFNFFATVDVKGHAKRTPNCSLGKGQIK